MVGVALTIGDMRSLNPKQQRFCEEYIVDLNGKQAAIRAGYAESSAEVTGSKLLRLAKVQECVQNLIAERSKKVAIDAAWVLKEFVKLYQKASAAEEVLDKEGNSLGVYRFDGATASRALENIGKHVGFFPGNQAKEGDANNGESSTTITSTVTVTHRYANLTAAFFDEIAGSPTQGPLSIDDRREPVDPGLDQGRADN